MSAAESERLDSVKATATWQHVARHSFAAVCALALEPGSLQERLDGACDALLGLESREVPEPMREEFGALIVAIMAVDEPESLTDDDALALARRILAFHERTLLL
jgi:hypothetical protein